MATRIQMFYGLDPDKPYVIGFYLGDTLAPTTAPGTPYDLDTKTLVDVPVDAYEWASAFEQGFINNFSSIGVSSFRCRMTSYPTDDPDAPDAVWEQDFASKARLAGLYVGVKGQVYGLKSFHLATGRPSLLAVGLINSSVETLGPGASAAAFANTRLNKFIAYMNASLRYCVSAVSSTSNEFKPLSPIIDQMYHSVRRHH